jgi:uncharacterized protein (UPF0335 family)
MIRIKPEPKKRRVASAIDPEKLKRYVERIEAVEAEEADQKAAKKDIYVEVKAAGMRPKMVRKIVKERKAKAVDAAEEAELDAYRAALAMPGATYRSVAEKVGMPKSTLHRLVPRAKNGTEPKHDPETGEITETESPAAKASDAESHKGPLTSPDLAGAAGGAEAPAPIHETPVERPAGASHGDGCTVTSPAPATANSKETGDGAERSGEGGGLPEVANRPLKVASAVLSTISLKGKADEASATEAPPTVSVGAEARHRAEPVPFITDAQALAALDEAEASYLRRVSA